MCSYNCCEKKKLLNFSWMIRKNFLDKYDKTEFGRKLCICTNFSQNAETNSEFLKSGGDHAMDILDLPPLVQNGFRTHNFEMSHDSQHIPS